MTEQSNHSEQSPELAKALQETAEALRDVVHELTDITERKNGNSYQGLLWLLQAVIGPAVVYTGIVCIQLKATAVTQDELTDVVKIVTQHSTKLAGLPPRAIDRNAEEIDKIWEHIRRANP